MWDGARARRRAAQAARVRYCVDHSVSREDGGEAGDGIDVDVDADASGNHDKAAAGRQAGERAAQGGRKAVKFAAPAQDARERAVGGARQQRGAQVARGLWTSIRT
ncbi:hypothetical protein B0H14DRAFT_2647663 [Mycena olivaceomarginata]|nr:hypothetical protein B0H14DRAFT_2647663 [Mycena olivaceomarginata]